MENLKERAVVGITWALLQQLSVKGLSLAVTLILAWYLTPEQFGLIAMIAIFFGVGNAILESGFQQALIRLTTISSEDLNTAFYSNVVIGCLVYCLIFFTAPAISGFYGEERLLQLVRVAGIVIIINSFQTVQIALLNRELKFRTLFLVVLPIALIASAVAIVFAVLGAGEWAIVYQMLSFSLLNSVVLFIIVGWKPKGAPSIGSLRRLLGFSVSLTTAAIIQVVYRNMYVVVIAKIFSASSAGMYFFADRIREATITQLVAAIQRVTFPAISTLQSDQIQLKKAFRELFIASSFLVFPVVIGIAIFIEPVLVLLLPEPWQPSIAYVQILALAALLMPIHAVNLNIYKVLGRGDVVLRLEVIKKAIAIAILLISIDYGIMGVLFGQILNSIVGYFPNGYFAKGLIDYGFAEQIKDFGANLMLSCFIGLVFVLLFSLFEWEKLTELIFLGLLFPIMYLVVAWVFNMQGYRLCTQIFGRLRNGLS